MSEQTKLCGTAYKVAVDVSKVDLDKREVILDEYETVKAKKIIIATGTSPNLMGIPGERELKGKGISYCATCDAKYYGERRLSLSVVVIRLLRSQSLSPDLPVKSHSFTSLMHLLQIKPPRKS